MCNFYSWLLILFFLFIAGVLLNAPFFSQFISSHQQQRHLLRAWKIEINWTSSSLRRSFMCFTSKTKLQLTYVQRGRSFELCMCVTWSSLWRLKDNSCLLFFQVLKITVNWMTEDLHIQLQCNLYPVSSLFYWYTLCFTLLYIFICFHFHFFSILLLTAFHFSKSESFLTFFFYHVWTDFIIASFIICSAIFKTPNS